jgi:sigma-B regulation protein RsbU (phosphoserine phosphatase)
MKSDGVVVDWNDRAAGVFGWPRDGAVGWAMADLIIPERYREAHRNGLQRYLETGIGSVLGTRIEVAGLRKNGEELPVELSISPVRDGRSIFFVGCLRDVTERNALHLARGEVSRVTQRMAMGEMAASIVREINQPAAAVVANANEALRLLAGSAPDLNEARAACGASSTTVNASTK